MLVIMNDTIYYYDWSLDGRQTNDPRYPNGHLPIGDQAPRIFLNGICVNGCICRATTGDQGSVEVYMRAFPKRYTINPRNHLAYRFTMKGRVTSRPV